MGNLTQLKKVVVPSKTFDKNLNCHCPRNCPEIFIVQSSKVQRSRTRDGSATPKAQIYQYFNPVNDENVGYARNFSWEPFKLVGNGYSDV